MPRIIVAAGDDAVRRFVEFFAATIRNGNTRAAYAQAIGQFLDWCESKQLSLGRITPLAVSAYVETMTKTRSAPTVKQHLAAIRMCFDWLVTGQVVPTNPSGSVRGPRHVVKRGKTPVLTAAEARQLLDAIDTSTLHGLRDRAVVATMLFTFARVSAVVGMNVGDYYPVGRRAFIRLHEKGGKHHELPAHHNAAEYLDGYVMAAGIGDDRHGPLFRTFSGKAGRLTENRMTRSDVLRTIKSRAVRAGLPSHQVTCHTFRATGITAYLENGGTLEHAQAIAAHESPRTTKLYDRTADAVTLDEIERIAI